MAAILAGLFGLMIGAIKYMLNRALDHYDARLSSYDERFINQAVRLGKNEEAVHELEKGVLRMKADLSQECYPKEDFVRFELKHDKQMAALYAAVASIKER